MGAAAGAIVGKFAGHKIRGSVEEQVSQALTPGTALVIGIFPADQQLAVERTLAGAVLKSTVTSDEDSIGELKRALAED